MKKWIRENPHCFWALAVPLFLLFFFTAEALAPTTGYAVMYHPLDDMIPFCEIFILAYVLWFPFLVIPGLYFMIRDGAAFRRYIWYIVIGFCGALIFAFFYPNGQELRPALDTLGRDNLFVRLVSMIYAADTNTNVCPSMHVIGSFGVVFAFFDCKTLRHPVLTRMISIALATLISVSTVFVKQHSVVDIFWGLVSSAVLYGIVYIFLKKKVTYFEKARRTPKP